MFFAEEYHLGLVLRSVHMRPHLLVSKTETFLYGPDIFLAERHNDFGKHIYVLKDPAGNTVEFLKILYIYLIGYFSATSFIKLAM